MQHQPIEMKAAHHWDVHLSPEGKCYIVRDKSLVLEAFRIGKIAGVYNAQPFVIYRKLEDFSIQDGMQRKDMPRAHLGELLKDAQSYPVALAFDGGESFSATLNFYALAQEIEDSGKISPDYKKILSEEDAKKCWEIFMKHTRAVHTFNGKRDGLASEFALGREIGVALDLEPESSKKYWELMQNLQFT